MSEYLDVSKCTPGLCRIRKMTGTYMIPIWCENTWVASVDAGRPGSATEAKANALLIAEAFTVADKTGKGPGQLADENEELRKACQAFSDAVNPTCSQCGHVMSIGPDGLISWFDFQCSQCGKVCIGTIYDAVDKARAALADRKD